MVFSLIVMILLWVATAVRLPTLWRDRRQRALWTAVFALALAKSASFPPVAARLHAAIVPNLIGVAVAFCLLRFIALVTGAGSRRWPLVVTAGVLVTLGVLGAIAGSEIDNRGEVLAGPLPPAAVAYWVALESYLGAVLVSVGRLFWTVGRAAPAGLPRLGLRAIAAGAAVISLYAATKTILIVVHGFGAPIAFERIEPVAHVIQAAAILVAVAGSLVPATRRARAVVAAYRSLLKLRPLWRAMKEAFPEVILFSPRRAVIELAGVDDVDLRLYRRVIEIRDGMLALRDYRPPDVPDDADPAVTEARGIALALRRHAAGVAPAEQPEAWAPVGPAMADEVAWLSRVSDAFRGLTEAAAPIPRPSGSAR
ncbi:MAB_1171c family putative transporter [Actinoplanes sp. NPDC051411]|uniref:MAB_1171c family putative transporter n=1 Tax=Actinoplanes sp. NPDC051411 TaxID=3155522 RepID=UPI003440DF6F